MEETQTQMTWKKADTEKSQGKRGGGVLLATIGTRKVNGVLFADHVTGSSGGCVLVAALSTKRVIIVLLVIGVQRQRQQCPVHGSGQRQQHRPVQVGDQRQRQQRPVRQQRRPVQVMGRCGGGVSVAAVSTKRVRLIVQLVIGDQRQRQQQRCQAAWTAKEML